jgi:lipoic acid synthetase
MSPDVATGKPDWLKKELPQGAQVEEVRRLMRANNLSTVCEEARCPNRGECWSEGEATVMIMGDTCTRGCGFCHVNTEAQGNDLDPMEPARVAATVDALDLDYVVVTSVDRDDLPDQGADHWAKVIRKVRRDHPDTVVDVLLPDFQGDRALVETVVEADPHVLAHNVETVERLTPRVRDARAGYQQSLDVLETFTELRPDGYTKTGLMAGLGETREELRETMRDLRDVGVDFLTVGQYLQPSGQHLEVERWVPPDEFDAIEDEAREMGFEHVVAGPFVRSSYKAWEVREIVVGDAA